MATSQLVNKGILGDFTKTRRKNQVSAEILRREFFRAGYLYPVFIENLLLMFDRYFERLRIEQNIVPQSEKS